MTLDELKRLRERLNDAGYAVIAETCRVLLDREIERESPLDGPFVRAVEARFNTNQGGGGSTEPEPVAEQASVRGPAAQDSAAAASFEERVTYYAPPYSEGELREIAKMGVVKAEDHERVVAAKDAEIARLTKERDEENKVKDDALDARDRWRDLATKRTNDLSAVTADRDALKAALDEERKASHEAYELICDDREKLHAKLNDAERLLDEASLLMPYVPQGGTGTYKIRDRWMETFRAPPLRVPREGGSMTTYQRGHEPAGAPVTWEYTNANGSVATLYGIAKPFVQVPTQYADHIARLAHAAAEWRKLAEEAASDTCPMQVNAEWMSRFDAMKEAFGE